MNDGAKGILTILYVNGTEQKFEYTRAEDVLNLTTRMQEILKADQIMIELEDRLLIIPFQNIQLITTSPPPPKLPPNALRNVRLIE